MATVLANGQASNLKRLATGMFVPEEVKVGSVEAIKPCEQSAMAGVGCWQPVQVRHHVGFDKASHVLYLYYVPAAGAHRTSTRFTVRTS